MSRIARMVVVVLSLALVVGAIINAAQATNMAMDMSAAGHSGEMMPGCDDCSGGDDGSMTCPAPCLTPVTAVLPVAAPVASALTNAFVAARTQALVDHRRPPDPYPPRSTVVG